MKSLLVTAERNAFSQRLKDALLAAGFKPSATTLAREFNMRSPSLTVTCHAVRKWLVGEAIPAQDRLHVIAEMLGTSPHWLRFGEGARGAEWAAPDNTIPHEIAFMFEEAQRLDPRSRELLNTLVQKMLKQQAPVQLEATSDVT